MSEGRKPRRKAAVVTDAALDGPADVRPASDVREAEPVPADEPSRQLALIPDDPDGEPDTTGASDATEDFDESADLLVSVSNETLVQTVPEGDEYDEDEPTAESDEAVESWTGASPTEEGGAYTQQAPRAPAAGSLLDQSGLEIRLARIHLRTGSLFMARAEFEAIAAREQLDTAAHLDLAEARWRTGDLLGAGEAATAYLARGGGAALGFVIAAEAFAMTNRHAEARRHTELALERHLSELDPLFAGMPRRASWPAGAWAPATAVEPAAVVPAAVEPAGVEPAAVEPAAVEPAAVEPAAVAVPSEPDAHAAQDRPAEAEGIEPPAAALPSEEPAVAPTGEAAPAQVSPAETPVQAPAVEIPAVETGAAVVARADQGAGAEVAAGRSFLEAGDPMMAALHFGVAIRLAPASAAAVLDAIGDREDLPLRLVRGDALRLLGLEADAGSTYLSVASALGAGRSAVPEAPFEATAPAPEPTARPTPEEPPAPEEPASAVEPPAPEPPAPEPPAPEPPAPSAAEPPTPREPVATEPPMAGEPPGPEEPLAEEPPPLHWE